MIHASEDPWPRRVTGPILAAALLALSITLTACGSDDDDGSSGDSAGASSPADLYDAVYAAVSDDDADAFDALVADDLWFGNPTSGVSTEEYFEFLSGDGAPEVELPAEPSVVSSDVAAYAEVAGRDEDDIAEDAEEVGVSSDDIGGVLLKGAQFDGTDLEIAFVEEDGSWFVWGSYI